MGRVRRYIGSISKERKIMEKVISAGDEIRRKSDRELAEFMVRLNRCGVCHWCIHKVDCYSSTNEKCVTGVKAFLGKTVRYEEDEGK